jgi:pimeloyl-ACP methyl ester carboxylesterase
LIWNIARENGIADGKQSWLDHPMFEASRENSSVSPRLEQSVEDYSGWHLMNPNPAISVKPLAVYRLEQISVPLLAVVGARDLPDFHRAADEMERRVPGACKVVLPDAGHMSNMDNPTAFNDAVSGFLAGA